MKSSALGDHESREVSFTLRCYTGSGKTCALYLVAVIQQQVGIHAAAATGQIKAAVLPVNAI